LIYIYCASSGAYCTNMVLQIIRQFDIEVLESGRYVVVGGVAYNEGFLGKLVARSDHGGL